MVSSESSLGEVTLTRVKMWQLRANSSKHCIVLAYKKWKKKYFLSLFAFVHSTSLLIFFLKLSFLGVEDVKEKNYPEALSALYHGIEYDFLS